MTSIQSSTCLLCAIRLHLPIRTSGVPSLTRHASTYKTLPRTVSRTRGPSRMNLAAPTSLAVRPGRPNRRKQDGPFGGMNQTKVPEDLVRRTSMRPRNEGGFPSTGGRLKPGRGKGQDFKALRMQQALTSVSYDRRGRIKEAIREVQGFDDFELMDSVRSAIATQALSGMQDIVATPVQKIAIPALLGTKKKRTRNSPAEQRQEFLIAAETGSGKTLAYLLPTIHAVKQAESEDADIAAHEREMAEQRMKENNFSPPLTGSFHPTKGRPRAVILVPTAELVAQVGSVVKSMSHAVKFRAALISSNVSAQVIRSRLFSPGGIDIVVSTPHLLSSIAENDPNILARVSHLIIDEADSLLDRGFAPLTSAIIDKAMPSLRQLVMCSATIPRSMDNFLRKRFPDTVRLVTPNLHAIPRRVQLSVVDVEKGNYHGNKDLACADTIWGIGKAAAEHDGPVSGEVDVKRILVFVNERETTTTLTEYLISKGIDAVALTRDTSDARQGEMLSLFTRSEPLRETKVPPPASSSTSSPDAPAPNFIPLGHTPPPGTKRTLAHTKVLVTTDLGSRGIDTLAVRHVILYDVPHSTIDFIHRLGRTGRMGRRGRGFVLVGKNDRRDVVAEVKEGMFMGQALI